MNTGLWVWPADAKAQRRMLRKVSNSEHLVAGMQAIAKSKDGLSNAQIDDALSDYSNWQTRWVVEQLISLGFAEYKVDFFGGPGKYLLTELGRNALSAITGKPVQAPPPPAPSPPPAKPAAPPASPATPAPVAAQAKR
jgi:hypothetical protein